MYLHACKGIFRLLSARAWRVELGDFKEVPDMLNTETVAASDVGTGITEQLLFNNHINLIASIKKFDPNVACCSDGLGVSNSKNRHAIP